MSSEYLRRRLLREAAALGGLVIAREASLADMARLLRVYGALTELDRRLAS